MPTNAKSTTIPLVCILCPGAKRFSDLSHLLTHLNSKSHLQSKHKLELQAAADVSARNILDSFAVWYNNNNFAELLSDRLNPKVKKASRRTAKTKKSKTQDVQSEVNIKTQHDFLKSNNFPAPELQMKAACSHSDGSVGHSPDQSPKAAGLVPDNQTSSNEDLLVDPALENAWKAGVDSGPGKVNGGPLVLKGEKFDGMDVFDAATPRTKRKRNQRKGPQVLEQMMKTSAGVEPAELSYHPSGEFRGARDIYGPPSDAGSPVNKKTPTPKRRKTTRVALQDKPINIPRPKTVRSQQPSSKHGITERDTTLPQKYGTFAFLKHDTGFDTFSAYQTVNPIKLENRGEPKDEEHDDNQFDLRHIPESPLYRVQDSLQDFIADERKLFKIQSTHLTNQGRFEVDRRYQGGFGDNPLQMTSQNYVPDESPGGKGLIEDVISGFNHPLLASNPLATWGSVDRYARNDQPHRGQLGTRHSSKKSKAFLEKDITKSSAFCYDPLATWPQSTSTTFPPTGMVQVSESKQKEKKRRATFNNPIDSRASLSSNKIIHSSPQTPVTHRWSLRSGNRHTKHLDCTLAEDNVLTTPKSRLTQQLSPKGHSPPRSLRSSARQLRSGHRLQYGSDPDTELFGVSGFNF